MINKKRKGFTVVELVFVVAVIAVLAAILIPMFSRITDKAKISADEQAVRDMNLAFAADEPLNGKPDGIDAARNVLMSGGFNSCPIPVTSGHAFYWIEEDNRAVLVKMKTESDETMPDGIRRVPDEIVFPDDLGEKYSSVPGEGEWLVPDEVKWFPLGPTKTGGECPHQHTEYIAIVDGEENTSTKHIRICRDCNEELGREDHVDADNDNICDLCRYDMNPPAAPQEPGQVHVHAYRYAPNGDGTHNKLCPLCGESEKEHCVFDANGKCILCGYERPIPPSHIHDWTYTQNDDEFTHRKVCGCGAAENEPCMYRYDGAASQYVCIYCGRRRSELPPAQSIPQPQNNFHEQGEGENRLLMMGPTAFTGLNPSNVGEKGLYYKEGVLYTGNDAGHTYMEGMLVLSRTDSGDDYGFEIPADAPYLTSKVVADAPASNANVTVTDNSGKGYKISRFSMPETKCDDDNVLNIAEILSDGALSDEEYSQLKNTEGQAGNQSGTACPVMITGKSGNAAVEFDLYLSWLFDSHKDDLGLNAKPDRNWYFTDLNGGASSNLVDKNCTVEDYLLEKYEISKLADFYNNNTKFQKLINNCVLSGNDPWTGHPHGYWANDATFDGIIGGAAKGDMFAEKNLAFLACDILYNHGGIPTGIFKDSQSRKSFFDALGFSGCIEGFEGANWMQAFNESDDWKSKGRLYGYTALWQGIEGEALDDICSVSGNETKLYICYGYPIVKHEYLFFNSMNGVLVCQPENFEIIFGTDNWEPPAGS